MKSGQVLYKNELAGMLTIQLDNGSYIFQYDERWKTDQRKPAISLTFPKNKTEYQSHTLFPFFFNMIPEGENKRLVCHKNRIDLEDCFGILLEVCSA